MHFLNIFEPNQTMCAAPHAPAFQTMHMPRDGANTVDSYIYRHWVRYLSYVVDTTRRKETYWTWTHFIVVWQSACVTNCDF